LLVSDRILKTVIISIFLRL